MTGLDLHIPIATDAYKPGTFGLAMPVLRDHSISPMVAAYYLDFLDELTSHGIRAKGWLQNPWGRWPRVPIHGEAFGRTSMRLDQRRLAQKSAGWLDQSVRDNVEAHNLGVYVGSNPLGGVAIAGLLGFRETGITFDASAYHDGTALDNDIRQMHADGVLVYREANRIVDRVVPCVAKFKPFTRGFEKPALFHSPGNAPAGSRMWFPEGINTPVEWAWAELAVRAGMGLRVNLKQTESRTRLYQLVGAA